MKDLLDKSYLEKEVAYSLCHYLSDKIDLFNISNHIIDLPTPFSFNCEIRDEIVFFPGSFNPWHQGHSACLEGCFDKPIVIIPDHNPWKDIREINPWSEVVHIKNKIMKLNKRNILIYPGFLIRDKKNPTSSWLPNVNVSKKWLLVGDDLFLEIHKWHQASLLFDSLYGLYVCPRAGDKNLLEKQKKELVDKYGLNIVFLEHHEYEELSSSKIRDNIS